MTTKILGKVAITPRGEWVAGTYDRLDAVSFLGGSYLSKKYDNTSNPTVAADWMKIAEKGDAFTYIDFTPEQIAELQRPATDAAALANIATENANDATEEAIIATQNAIAATDSLLSNIISLEIRDDLCLWFETPPTYDGITFDITNGNLIATI